MVWGVVFERFVSLKEEERKRRGSRATFYLPQMAQGKKNKTDEVVKLRWPKFSPLFP
jgi:hypothetical protein